MADLIYASKEQAPEALRALLTERDGKFILFGGDSAEVPGYRRAADFEEFRTNNITLKQELEQLKAAAKAFEGLDPSKAREALKRVRELEQGDVNKLPDGVRAMLQRQADEFKALKEQFDSEKAARAKAEDQNAEMALTEEIKRHLAPYVLDAALPDALNRIRPLLVRGDDRSFRPVENGTPLLSSKNTGQPMGLDELVAAKIVNDPTARHMLKPSKGSALNGNSAGAPPPSGQVPWGDMAAMGACLEDIAAGKVAVVNQS